MQQKEGGFFLKNDGSFVLTKFGSVSSGRKGGSARMGIWSADLGDGCTCEAVVQL